MYALKIFSQFQANPGIKHWCGLLKLLRYLQYTKSYTLELSKIKFLKLILISLLIENNRISIRGYITFIDETLISKRTFKHKSIGLSTIEAEYITLTEATKELTWLKNILENKSLNLRLNECVGLVQSQLI